MMGVADDTDYNGGFVGIEGGGRCFVDDGEQMFAERILIGPERLGHALVDYNSARGAGLVGICEEAAANQAKADEGKIVGRYVASRGEFGALSWLARMAFGIVNVAQVKAGHG